MRIVIYDQKSKGKPNGRHVAAINSWTATWSHGRRRKTKLLMDDEAEPEKDATSRIKSAASDVSTEDPTTGKQNPKEKSDMEDLSPTFPGTSSEYISHQKTGYLASNLTRVPSHNEYPYQLTSAEYRLVEYYTQVMCYEMCGVTKRKGQVLRFDHFRDCFFQASLQHPLLFRVAVLGLAAGHGATTRDCFTADLDYQQYRSLQEMQAHFKDVTNKCSDLSIAVCLQRAMLDLCLGGAGRPLMHMRIALHMIQMRGGYRAFVTNKELLPWLMTSSWCFAREDLPYPDTSTSLASSKLVLKSSDDEKYLRFLVDAANLSNAHRALNQNNPSLRQVMFVHHPYIRSLLLHNFGAPHTFRWQDVDLINRLVLLIFLNKALLDFQHDSMLTDLFLEDFRQKMLILELDNHQSVRPATRIIVQFSAYEQLNSTHWERLWFTTQMLRWVVHLSRDQEEQVTQLLYMNLMYSTTMDGESPPCAMMALTQVFAEAEIIDQGCKATPVTHTRCPEYT